MKHLSLRKKAIQYRKNGYSYNMIKNKLAVSKSTLSDWLKNLPFVPNAEVIKRIGLAKVKSAIFKNRQKMDNILAMKTLAQKELGKMTKRDLWFLGIGLYLGEGTKSNEAVCLINSDPQIIKAALKWFRMICGLSNKNFSLKMYLYPDIDVDEAVSYWSKITKIPKNQFNKTQIDRRTNKSQKRRHKLPYGTLNIRIKSCGEKKFGKSLHRRITGWMETTLNQI